MSLNRISHLPQPNLIDFKLQKWLGKGAYGKVGKYTHIRTNIPYVIKVIPIKSQDQKCISKIQKQIQILYKIKNKYIVQMIDHFIDTQKNQVHLIMEYLQGKDLHKCVFTNRIQLTYEQIAKIVYQIAIALGQLHKVNIIHRDLKLQNVIYLKNGSIKLIDFGEGNYFGQQFRRNTFVGTQAYYSPQLFTGDPQDDKLDMWCLGVLLYQLLFLKSPFNGPNMTIDIRRLNYQIPQSHKNDSDLMNLFRKLLCYKQNRINAHKFLQHPWIVKNIPKIDYINIQNSLIDKQELVNYKKFLLRQIEKYQQSIKKIKKQNKQLESMIQKNQVFN